jgi:hypothetical protein
MLARCRIGTEFGPSFKDIIVLVELSFQDSQPIELRKQVAGGFAHGTDRVVGMLGLPPGEITLRTREIEVVQAGEATIERRIGQAPGRTSGKRPQGTGKQQNCHRAPRACI